MQQAIAPTIIFQKGMPDMKQVCWFNQPNNNPSNPNPNAAIGFFWVPENLFLTMHSPTLP